MLDLILIIFFLLFIIRGYNKGFVNQMSVILGLFISFYLALKYYPQLHNLLLSYLELSRRLLDFISFSIIFIFFNIVIHLLGEGIKNVFDLLFLKPLDSLAGAFLGLVKGMILIYLVLLFSDQIPYQKIETMLDSSLLAGQILDMSPIIQKSLEDFFKRP